MEYEDIGSSAVTKVCTIVNTLLVVDWNLNFRLHQTAAYPHHSFAIGESTIGPKM